PNAAAERRPSPVGRSVVVQPPFRPRVWISQQRTCVESPGAIVNEAGPFDGFDGTADTRGAAGTREPSHGNAGTIAFSWYSSDSIVAKRLSSANSAPRRK